MKKAEPMPPSVFDEVDVEMKMKGRAYRLLAECVFGRDESHFTEDENRILDRIFPRKDCG